MVRLKVGFVGKRPGVGDGGIGRDRRSLSGHRGQVVVTTFLSGRPMRRPQRVDFL
jgi:hypothetical protein